MLHISTGRQCGYDTTVRTVLFSFLVNITFQHLVLIFDPNSGLPHPRRTAMSVYVSCLNSYYNGVIYSYRDGKGHSSEFFNSQLPRYILFGSPEAHEFFNSQLPRYILFGSPEAHESDVSVVRRTRCSVPPPSRMKRQSTVLNGDGTRVFIGFCTARHPELASAGVSQNPFRGTGPLFCTARTRWILSCNKLASDRHAPLDVPAKGTTRKRPPQTQLL